jgi:hypothetical protein
VKHIRRGWHSGFVASTDLTDFEHGLIVGLLIGEGHFGGDGRKPQVTLRMHVRHERLLRWLHERLPRSRLYGPYHHGGRHYFQWMMRGAALRDDLMPLFDIAEIDDHVHARLTAMRERYPRTLAGEPSPGGVPTSPGEPAPPDGSEAPDSAPSANPAPPDPSA